jgi:peptidoglycan/xylan/chitin deacetylase (PgdA/CDA1 family)
LDIVAAAGVKATFCQIGSQLAGFPDVERRLIADGHTLCNHSWTHPDNIAALAPAQIDQQIGDTQQAFAQFGVTVRYFRAPAGDFGKTTTTLRQLCQRYQTRPLGWAVDPQDWKKPGVTKIVQTVLSTVAPGAVILLHMEWNGMEWNGMAAAAPASRGVRCLTLPLRCRCGGQWVAVRRGHRWWGHDHVWWLFRRRPR